MQTSILFACALALCPFAAADAQADCTELGKYRDGPLFQQWNAAITNADLYAANHLDVAAMRKQLLSDATWQTSDWLLLTGIIASSVKTTTDLIGNLAAFAPEEGLVTGTASAIKKALEAQELVSSAQEDGPATAIGLYVAAEMNPVGKATKAIYKLGRDVHEQVYLPKDRDELKETIHRQLDNLDAALAKNDAFYKKWANKAEALNRIHQGIDAYALANCGQQLRSRGALKADAKAGRGRRGTPATVSFPGRKELSDVLNANWGGPLDQPMKTLMLRTWPMSVIYYLAPAGQTSVAVDLADARWSAWDKVAPADAGQSAKYGKILSLESIAAGADGRSDEAAVFCRLAAKFRGRSC